MAVFHRVTLTGGAFQDALGNPLNGGSVTFKLSTDTLSQTSQVIAGRLVTAVLDSNGNISGTVVLWSNDVASGVQPAGTVYRIKVYSSEGQQAWETEATIPSTAATFDLGTLVPIVY